MNLQNIFHRVRGIFRAEPRPEPQPKRVESVAAHVRRNPKSVADAEAEEDADGAAVPEFRFSDQPRTSHQGGPA